MSISRVPDRSARERLAAALTSSRRRQTGPVTSVLYTGGIGDAIAAESTLSAANRSAIETIYYAAPAAKEIRALFEASDPYAARVRHVTLPTGRTVYYSKPAVESALSIDLTDTTDMSVSVLFPTGPAYTGSSVLTVTADNPAAGVGPYVVVVPGSTWYSPPGRNFDDADWDACLSLLGSNGLVGVALSGGHIPIPHDRRLVNLQGRTGITESVAAVKGAVGYVGIDSWVSVLASKLFPSDRLAVKVQEHARHYRHIYYAPHTAFQWLASSIGDASWGRAALPSGGGPGVIYTGCDRWSGVAVGARLIREMGCRWPIQAWYRPGDPVDRKVASRLDVTLIDLESTANSFEPFNNPDRTVDASVAARYTSFDRALVADSSVYPCRMPCRLDRVLSADPRSGFEDPDGTVSTSCGAIDRSRWTQTIGPRPFGGRVLSRGVEFGTGVVYATENRPTLVRLTAPVPGPDLPMAKRVAELIGEYSCGTTSTSSGAARVTRSSPRD